MIVRRAMLPILTAVGALAATASPALATLPGTNGQILYTQSTTRQLGHSTTDFESIGDIRAIAADGSADHAIHAQPIAEDTASPSPDGQRIAYVMGGALWTSNIDGTNPRPVTGTQYGDGPSWSPDGRRIAYYDDERGIKTVEVDAEGTTIGRPRTVIKGDTYRPGVRTLAVVGEPEFTPDGLSLVYARIRFHVVGAARATSSIWMARADGKGAHRILHGTGESRAIAGFSLSPDGRQIAYIASESAKRSARRLFVSNLDGGDTRTVATADAGTSAFDAPAWSPDGTRIALAENAKDPQFGARLKVIDAATARATVIKRVDAGRLGDVQWQPLP